MLMAEETLDYFSANSQYHLIPNFQLQAKDFSKYLHISLFDSANVSRGVKFVTHDGQKMDVMLSNKLD